MIIFREMALRIPYLHIALILSLLVLLSSCSSLDENLPPTVPVIISGTDSAGVDQAVEIVVVAEDPEGGLLTYEIDWGDDRGIERIADIESGLYYTLLHHFFDPDIYHMRCRTIDDQGRPSSWSAPFRIAIGGTAAAVRGDWWMFMRDPQHSGQSPFVGPASPVLAWTLETGSPLRSSVSYDSRGTLYFGGDNFQLQAYYGDGTKKWSYSTGSARISNTPALGLDGALYFGSSSANIYRINRSGIKDWNYSVKSPIQFSNAVIDSEGRVYIGSEDHSIYCLSAEGMRIWELFTNGSVHGSPALSRDEKFIYCGSDDQLLYCVDRAGVLQWTYATAAPIIGSPSVSPNGNIIFGSGDQFLYALTPEGSLLWKRDLRAPIHTPPAITPIGNISVATSAGLLFLLQSDGTVLWDTRFAASAGRGSPVLDILGNAYIGSPDGILTAISSTGQILWRYDTEFPINATASIGPDGGIAVGNDKGTLYVLRER